MAALYTGPIIDAHHHLWDLSMGAHPWLSASDDSVAALQRNYCVEEYVADAARHNVVGTVHVEANWREDDLVGETRWLETLDKSSGVALCYVARVPLGAPNAVALLDEQASFERVVGIRDILSWHEDRAKSFVARRDIMDDPAWRAGLAHLGRLGLSFDLMIFPGQAGDALRLARDFPEIQFVLNHCGSPIDRDDAAMARWREGLWALATAPNVSIKISDLVAYDHDWTLESLRSVVLHCIDCFGTDRSLFASDFPVAGLHADFDEVYGSFKTIVADFSAAEQRALFYENARRLYRMPLDP